MRKFRRACRRSPANPTVAFWTPDAPINKPITSNPLLDPDNDTIISYLAANAAGKGTMDCTLWSVPIYYAGENTRRVLVGHASSLDPTYGTLPSDGWPVPVDPSWKPASEEDGHISIIDTNGWEYSFWKFVNGDTPTAAGGGITDIRSDRITSGFGGATAANFARAAGLVRVEEWERGYIDHALFVATSLTRTGTPPPYRFPALKSDGKNLAGAPQNATIVMGARLQLDPAFDVDAKSSWLPWHRIVAKALQTYGVYVGDTSGNIWGMLGEIPQTTTGAGSTVKHNNQTMYNLGILDRYAALPSDFPWSSMRVLATWDDTVPVPPNPKVHMLRDTFPGPGLDRSFIWQGTNATAVRVEDGRAVIPQTGSYSNALVSGKYDATDSRVFARVYPVMGSTYVTTMALRADKDNWVQMSAGDTTLGLTLSDNGVDTGQSLGGYDPVKDAWWRLREFGGTFYADTSPDGFTWTQRGSVRYPWQATSVAVYFNAGFQMQELPANSYIGPVNIVL